jgi:divalent metal cation (Fe/Co/Zn/Cd) transporter
MTALGDSGRLYRLLWLSVAAAVATIALKTAAWLLTGSVGLLSDAAESVVNLVAAGVALAALHWAAKPADDHHAYGHAKAEYLSAGFEGALIVVAALTIVVSASGRLVNPQPLSDVGVGLAISAAASLINLTVGVLLGVAAVALTGWERLDPIVALAVAMNIEVTGIGLLRRSAGGLMDEALDDAARGCIEEVLDGFRARGVDFHALRTRQAGRRAFVSVHVLVPGAWTVQRGHDLAEEVEARLREQVPEATVFTHLEPAEDPKSFDDTALDRADSSPRPALR